MKTVGRRTVLEWLGGATVIALGSPLLASCGASPAGARTAGGDAGGDAGGASGGDAGCDFEPGTTTIKGWPSLQVDEQDVASLIATWSLSISGLVTTPLKAAFCDLQAMGLSRQVTDFHCVEGWSVYDVPWDGIPLAKLLARVGPTSAAKYLKIHCVGGKYYEELPIEVAMEEKSMLALGIDGSTLPLGHGFPARIVVPRLLGYKNAKYVDSIELVDTQPSGFWEQYGYSLSGEVPASRLRPGKY